MTSGAKGGVLRHAAVYGLGGVVVQLGGFILLPLYTHHLTASEYGVMDLIERIGGVVNTCLMIGGIQQATLAFYLQARSEEERSSVPGTIGVLLLLAFGLAAAVVIPMSGPVAVRLGVEQPVVLRFGVLTVLSQMFLVLPLGLMQARVESVAFATVSVLMLVVRVSLAVLLVAVLELGVWGVYLSLLVTYIGFGTVLMLRELRLAGVSIDWEQFRGVVTFSLPFVPTGALFFLMVNGDRFFLVDSSGTEALGIYALGYTLAGAVGTLSWHPLFRVWTARMYEVFARNQLQSSMANMLTRLSVAYAAAATALCLFRRELLLLISTDSYQGAGGVIPLIVLANLCLLFSNFAEGVFYVHRRTRLKPVTALIGAGACVAFYAALIPRYAVAGAAIGTLLGYGVLALVTLAVAQRVEHVPYQWGKLLRLLLLSIAAVLVSDLWGLGVFELLGRIGLFVVWGGSVWRAGVIHIQDRRRLRDLAARVLQWRGWGLPGGNSRRQ